MAINIQSAEVEQLVGQLHELTGLDPTEIIKTALHREYQELKQQRRRTTLATKLPALQTAAQAKAQEFAADLLYDEAGLPQ